MKDNLCNKGSVSKVVPAKAKSENSQSKQPKFSTKNSSAKYCKKKPFEIAKVSNASLDTLETTSEFQHKDVKSSTKSDERKLRIRAGIKYYNNLVAVRLAELRTPLEEAYRDTYYCSSVIIKTGKKKRSGFCRRRWCINCNRIRTAQLINKYGLTIRSWEEKCFLTLTVKNPKDDKLVETIKTMHKFFTEIKDSERKAKRKLIGIRKLEITYNNKEDTYHPHFHFVLKDSKSADYIILKWLRKFNPHIGPNQIKSIKEGIEKKVRAGYLKKKYIELDEHKETIRKTMMADPQFQDYKQADNESATYLFKYFTKLTSNSSKDKRIIISALDKIFNSIHGLRTFQPFGFVAHKEGVAPEKKEEIKNKDEEILYAWSEKIKDWVNHDTGEVLSNYTPSKADLEQRKLVR